MQYMLCFTPGLSFAFSSLFQHTPERGDMHRTESDSLGTTAGGKYIHDTSVHVSMTVVVNKAVDQTVKVSKRVMRTWMRGAVLQRYIMR